MCMLQADDCLPIKEIIKEMNKYTFQLMEMKSSACARHKVQTLFHYIYKYLLDHLQYLADRTNISHI